MQLTFILDGSDEPLNLQVDPSMLLEDLSALLEAELAVPSDRQAIFFQGRKLTDPKASLASAGIVADEMLELQLSPAAASSSSSSSLSSSGVGSHAGSVGQSPLNAETDAERARLQILGNPNLMAQLRTHNPEMARAAEHSPERFRELMALMSAEQARAANRRRQDEELLTSDPFDIDAQRRIEEHIRQERVFENMEHAMEYSPESFGRVTMLYVDVQVNGHPVKAFVDSGAQMTVISPECAEKTGIMRLLDRRYSGIARGVGVAKILGRVHSAQLRLGTDLYLPCSFTVMEGKGVDLLFGLDMLKRHQATIDLSTNHLVIQGRRIRFLSEHELPRNAIGGDGPDGEGGDDELELDEQGNVVIPKAPSAVTHGPPGGAGGQRFPGSGQALGAGGGGGSSRPTQAPPAPAAGGSGGAGRGGGAGPRHDPQKVETLVGLGATRAQALELLDAAGGNVDVAASLIFGA